MAYYPYWYFQSPPDGDDDVSLEKATLSLALTVFTTPTYDFGTNVFWTQTDISVDTDVSVDSPTFYPEGPASGHHGTVNISEGLSGSTEYYYDFTFIGSIGSFTSPTYTFSTGGPPQKPANPTPANNATAVDFSAFGLSWGAAGGANTYDVYIGLTGDLTEVSSAQGGTSYTTNLEELETIFGVSPINQKIYWRVDATNDAGTTTGDEWNFDPRPSKITDSTPADEASNVTLSSTTGSWTAASENTTEYDVYFGTLSGFLSNISEDQEALECILSENNFAYHDIYYWRVDAKNQFGKAQGDEWSFTTMYFYPPLPHYTLILLDGPDFTYGDGVNYGGTEGTDWYWDGYNFIRTSRRLVAAAANTIWYEEDS